MAEELYEVDAKTITCPICDEDIKTKGARFGSDEKHAWRIKIEEGKIRDGRVKYPVGIVCLKGRKI